MEVWLPVVTAPDFLVSNLGRIKNKRNPCKRKGYISYIRIGLKINNVYKSLQLVA